MRDAEETKALPEEATIRAESEVLDIAAGEVGLQTMQTRNSDEKDFHELAIWQIRDALFAAYRAGFEAGRQYPND